MLEQNMSLANRQETDCREAIFSSLIDVLKRELIIFQELKNVIGAEKKILIKPSLDELNHSNAVKENIILKARMLEETRLNIFKKIARLLDINDSGIKLKRLAEYVGAAQGEEIKQLANELFLMSADINTLNEANKNLMDVSLGCIQNSLDFITSMISSQTVYMGTGQVKTINDNGKFLRTEG
jgi:flagellar biosynthesis/type III secretory pathway chaperone